MSDERVRNLPGRGSIDDPHFQRELKWWRSFAHRRGLVVGSSIRLIGAEKTIYGDSDNMTEGAQSYLLEGNSGVLSASVGGLFLSKAELAVLNDKERDIIGTLDDRADIDIGTIRAPLDNHVEEQEDERDRWDLVIDRRRIGTVVRVGEGSGKHYLLYLWIGGWRLVRGQPCFDLPLFGLAQVRSHPHLPIMIHEGPKAWDMANNRVDGYIHVAWHGSEWGMEWTDWTPLRGRRVLIWPDCDEAGIANARRLAARLAQMGGIIEYVNWSVEDVSRFAGWDWADDGGFSEIGEGEIRARTVLVESPVGPDGRVLKEWAERSFLDLARKEVYQVSVGYAPMPLDSLAMDKDKTFRREVLNSPINPFRGLDYRPGFPMGRMVDGRINTCPPTPRDALEARPFSRGKYREICRVWLRHMIPDRRERKHVIRRAAWAVARPERIPQHIVVLQGMSGIGKSVLLDLIVRVSGRGASLFPESIFTTFNNLIARRSVVAIHEIHAPSERQKDIAGKLKELIANSTIEIEEKNRPKISVTNVIHWFAATNERVPFALEHGNDRFYFVTCGNPPDVGRMRRFFRKWVPIFNQEDFVDELNAGAKWLVNGFSKKVQAEMQGRAERQDVWSRMEYASMRPWEKFLLMKMKELEEQAEEAKEPLIFFAKDLINLVLEKFQWRGVDDVEIRRRLNEFGYVRIERPGSKTGYQRRPEGGREKKTVVWCREKDKNVFLGQVDPGTARVFRLGDDG
jgi:hypothetical protein